MNLRICHFSDTKGHHKNIRQSDMRGCDAVIFSGNATCTGKVEEFKDFIDWFGDIPVDIKLMIGGNRDCLLPNKTPIVNGIITKFMLKGEKNFYLENSSCVIDGIRFYGCPSSRINYNAKGEMDFYNSTFCNYSIEGEQLNFNTIPTETQVLITSVPPKHILDGSDNSGSQPLSDIIETLPNLKAHCFGRAYNHGIYDTFDVRYSNGNMLSLTSELYEPNIFDIEIE